MLNNTLKKAFEWYRKDWVSVLDCVAFDMDGCPMEHNCLHGGKPVRDCELVAAFGTCADWLG